MYKPVLSPCLLDSSQYKAIDKQMDYCERVSEVVDFICDKTSLLFDFYTGAPYDTGALKPPIYSVSPIIKSKIQNIFRKIYSHQERTLNLLHNNEQWLLCDQAIDCDVTSASQCYIDYCLSNEIKVILFVSCKSKVNCKTYNENVYILDDISEIPIEIGELLISSDNSIFPKCDFCQYDNNKFKSGIKGLNSIERRAIIKETAKKVAIINGYSYSAELSNINSMRFHAERQIYISDNYYLSVDFESGGFEVFDKKLNHQGQYNFSGKKIRPIQKLTHKIVLK